jgi:hypothetical protein
MSTVIIKTALTYMVFKYLRLRKSHLLGHQIKNNEMMVFAPEEDLEMYLQNCDYINKPKDSYAKRSYRNEKYCISKLGL